MPDGRLRPPRHPFRRRDGTREQLPYHPHPRIRSDRYIQIMPKKTTLPPIRVSEAEKALIRERADACGLGVSEYVRRSAMALEPSAVGVGAGRTTGKDVHTQRSTEECCASVDSSGPDDFEAQVRRKEQSNGVGRRSAETLVKREMTRGR